ncbi:MAG: hypothetical protein MJ048_02860 [Acidaminococcaceae bacterium]|nr:hypothetical protein [Acidaminococcaceae bacterium]
MEKKTEIKGFRYAYVLGEKIGPSKKLHGSCPLCGEEVIAKCGNIRVHHWAHKNRQDCETFTKDTSEWHKSWQEKFPEEWREEPITNTVIKKRHRADICTPQGIVVEFQHSPIDVEEQEERESFYLLQTNSPHTNGMVWVVDATCYQQVQKHFEEEIRYILTKPINGEDRYLKNYYFLDDANFIFPKEWVNRNVFVFFDYFNFETKTGDTNLYCLFPKLKDGKRIIWVCPRDRFVNFVSNVDFYVIFLLYMQERIIMPARAIKRQIHPIRHIVPNPLYGGYYNAPPVGSKTNWGKTKNSKENRNKNNQRYRCNHRRW